MQRSAFHAGHKLHQSGVADIKNQAIDDLIAEIAVGHLTAFEAERCFHLVAVAKKADGLVLLRLIVVFIDGYRELDLFDGDDLLLLARSAIALVLLIKEFAVVLDLADWRDRVGGDLYKVERQIGRASCRERVSV